MKREQQEVALTELDCQFAIYNYRSLIQAQPTIIPNIYLYGNESDALFITKTLCVHEYEIKVTHSDFLADKKKWRHARLKDKDGHHPTTFSYVCPPDVISIEELPEYAGLYYVVQYDGYYLDPTDTGFTLSEQRRPPRLGDNTKITEKQLRVLLSKMSYRYWHHTSNWRNRYKEALTRRPEVEE